MYYLSVLVVLLFNQCKFKLGVYGACKDFLSTLMMDPMIYLGQNYGRSGVGWGDFRHNLPPNYSTNGYLLQLFNQCLKINY